MTERLIVKWANSVAETPQALWDIGFPPPLEGRWWYETLEKSGLHDQFQFFYAVVYDATTPIAIAPAFLMMNVPIRDVVPDVLLPLFDFLGKLAPSLRYQRTFFVGSPCADEGHIGILPGYDFLQVLLCLERAMRVQARHLRAPMFAWKDFPQSYARGLQEVAQHEGLFALTSYPGTWVELPSGGKQTYLSSLKSNHRHIFKKKLRRSAEHVEIITEILQYPDNAALDELFALFWQTYEKATTKFERLKRTFFTHIAMRPEAFFIVLRERHNGERVAFMLCFGFHDVVINKFIGIDYKRPKEWSLYYRLWDAAVDWAIDRGARGIQSGQTGYKVKIETGHTLLPLTHYCRHSNRLIHFVYKKFARNIRWDTLDHDLAIYAKAHPEVLEQES